MWNRFIHPELNDDEKIILSDILNDGIRIFRNMLIMISAGGKNV